MLISTDGVTQQYFASGGERADYRAHIRSHPWMPHEEMLAWQLRTLNRTLRLAKRDVPFYADRLPDDPFESLHEFERIRMLTRDEVVRAGPLMHSRAHNADDVVDVHTGGTTDVPLVLRVTRTALDRHYGCFMRFREWIGIRDGSRVAAFGGLSTIGGGVPCALATGNSDALICSADAIDGDSLEGYVTALANFAPSVIDGFPSAISPLARFVKAHNIRGIHPDAVITSGDVLTPGARRVIEEAFSCPVFDHYAAAEMAALITECRAGSYHVNSDYGIVEIVREGRAALPGETGEIVATGFLNEAMPLIRYATGDMAVAGSTHCPCGREFPTVERIVGRADESLLAPDGNIVPRLDQLFRNSASVIEARIVQDAPDHVTVEAVATGQLDPLEIATITNEIRQRIGPSLRVDLVRVPRIPRTTSGRYRAVQRLIFGGTAPFGEPRTLERVPA